MTQTPKKEVYSPSDIAKIVHVDASVVRGWVEEDKIRSFQIPGRHYRVSHEVLEKFMEENRFQRPSDWERPFEKFRVLVVEDDPDLLEIVAELLHDETRIEVRKEDSGFNAGLQIASWHPDLILLDFLMPGVSGFEISKKLREDPATTDMPILAMTSLAGLENRQAVFQSGVSDFLGKPFHSEELLKKVRILLGIPDRINRHSSKVA